MLVIKKAIKRRFTTPPQITCASALPGKTGKHENCIFTRMLYYTESKKGATLTMAITLSILDRFAKFFHCCKDQ